MFLVDKGLIPQNYWFPRYQQEGNGIDLMRNGGIYLYDIDNFMIVIEGFRSKLKTQNIW